ncbi:MAG: threonine/serine exporter [Angelakisella sp.]|nr:threonine/serine exporter [Angelakisella sp.]
MGFLTGFLLPCLYAVLACVAFCFILNQRGLLLVVSSLGGGVGWAVCLLCAFTGSDIVQYFAGAVAVALYAEVMARLLKAPATGFLVVGILPFVPGGGIYYTMEYCLSGNTQLFLSTGIHTFGVAGAVAVGLLLASSLVRLALPLFQRQSSR